MMLYGSKGIQECYLCGVLLGTAVVHEVKVVIGDEDRGRRRVCFDCMMRVIAYRAVDVEGEGRGAIARPVPENDALFVGDVGGRCNGHRAGRG